MFWLFIAEPKFIFTKVNRGRGRCMRIARAKTGSAKSRRNKRLLRNAHIAILTAGLQTPPASA
ncbi:MAG: hypothetical protein RLZZ61_805 [Pseudomonadota bacterium]|jgi:hypothetical protein